MRRLRPFALSLMAAVVPLAAEDETGPRFEIELEFQGNREVAAADLKRALSGLVADFRLAGVDASGLEDAVYELERYYAARGYPKVKIRARSFERPPNGIVLRFEIEEGRRTFLRKLTISGAEFHDPEELRRCFQWERSGLLELGRNVFSQAAFEDGIACVRALYLLDGFYFVDVRGRVEEAAPGEIEARVEIVEGPCVLVKKRPVLLGVRAFPLEDLYRAMQLELPAPFAPRLPLILKGKLLDYYRRRGYRFVDVRIERRVDREKAEAELIFYIEEGPLSRIREIAIAGNQITRRGVVERYLKLAPGDLFNEDRIRESHRSLLTSGLFESVTVDTEPLEGTAPSPNLRLRVKVDEKPRYRITLLAGYGSWEQLRGALSIEDTNVFGTGHRVRAEGRASFRGARGEATYLNPFFFHERLSHDALFAIEEREQRSFTERDLSGEMGVGWRITDRLRARAFYRLKDSRLEEVSGGVPPELEAEVLLSSVNLTAIHDTRTSFVNPQSGGVQRIAVEYADEALGSQLNFVRVTGALSWVVPLPWRLRLVPSARAGIIERLGEEREIPIQERFFLGGEDTIRSFTEDEAGPRIGGRPIGGEAFLNLNLELRFPIEPFRFLKGLDGAVFFDTGTVNERVHEFGGDRWFFGVGAGLRYNTPVGPFRVDFAFNPDRSGDEDLFVVHFGLGYPF